MSCDHFQLFSFHYFKQIPSSQIEGPFLHLNWRIFEIKGPQSYQISSLYLVL